jgi:hypothetical protein
MEFHVSPGRDANNSFIYALSLRQGWAKVQTPGDLAENEGE